MSNDLETETAEHDAAWRQHGECNLEKLKAIAEGVTQAQHCLAMVRRVPGHLLDRNHGTDYDPNSQSLRDMEETFSAALRQLRNLHRIVLVEQQSISRYLD
jgi:hypothetical protein